ncbi:MAG: BatD family protein [Flavobacteriales bacterium]|nr:BatD family protein [Flavobacteriales bacterium]
MEAQKKTGKMVCHVWIFLFMICISPFMQAQSFNAYVSKSKVAVGERFKLTYKLENLPLKDFRIAPLEGFSIVGGPYQSQSTTIINGQFSQSFEVSYYISANKTGKFTIQPASISANNSIIKSNAIEIEVVEGNVSAGNNTPSSSGNMQTVPPPTAGNSSGNDAYITATANRNSVYEGEPIALTIQLVSAYNSVSLEEIKYPEIKGGWVQDVDDAVDTRFRQEIVNGKRLNVATLRKSILIPQRSGQLIFDPVTARILVQKVIRTGNIWDDFFYGGQVKEERLNLKSGKITFNVLPLPEENRPASFTNAVGKFTLKVDIDKTELEANDAATLKVTIAGEGNLMLIEKPSIVFPNSFEVYDPQVNDKYKITSTGVTGSKTFEYLIIPRNGGNYTIGPIKFSYFDPKQKKYIELSSDSIKLKVNGTVVANPLVSANREVEFVGQDIRYIDDKNEVRTWDGNYFFRSALYFILTIVPFLLIALILVFRKKLFFYSKNPDEIRIKKASSVAVKRLKTAKKMLDENQKDAYFEEINKALLQYLRDKFGIEYAAINKDRIQETLQQKSIPKELIERLLAVLESCEMARFAPPGNEAQTDIYNETADIITTIEKQLFA